MRKDSISKSQLLSVFTDANLVLSILVTMLVHFYTLVFTRETMVEIMSCGNGRLRKPHLNGEMGRITDKNIL